jgi:GTP cyclohydrolase I
VPNRRDKPRIHRQSTRSAGHVCEIAQFHWSGIGKRDTSSIGKKSVQAQTYRSETYTESPSVTLEQNYTAILGQLGEDVSREGLLDTPKRAAKAMQYLCRGYAQTLEEVTNGALFSSDASEMVMVKDIELYSLCEHHLLPFIGKVHVAYIPQGKVLGLSKVARIVDMYARRLQIQENLSRQIAEAIQQVTGALGVAVVIEAKHMCMMMRGVEKQNSAMITSVMLGEFRENAATRSEFLSLIK